MRRQIAGLTAGLGLLVSTPAAHAGATQSSFTPTGYQYPIMSIQLAKADGSGAQQLYTCSGATAADCLVDLADPTALATITAAATDVAIDEGEYTQLRLSTCPAGTTGSDTMTVQVQGAVTVGADSFNTDDSALGGMSASGTPGFAAVPLGCGGAVVQLLQPLDVTAGSTQTLTLLVDLTDIVWTDANVPNPGPGGCRSDGDPTGQDLCTTIPKVVPYLGDGAPTFERYLVSHLADSTGTPALADANAAVSLAVDENSEVFYVIVQPWYSITSPSEADAAKGGPDYNASVRTFSKNADGSIAFQSGGDAMDNRAGFPAFQRMTHEGTCKNELPTSPTWYYQAFLQ